MTEPTLRQRLELGSWGSIEIARVDEGYRVSLYCQPEGRFYDGEHWLVPFSSRFPRGLALNAPWHENPRLSNGEAIREIGPDLPGVKQYRPRRFKKCPVDGRIRTLGENDPCPLCE